MKKWMILVGGLAGLATPALAIIVGLFVNTDTLIQRSHEIVIAKCVTTPTNAPWAFEDGLYPAEMKLMKNLKGERKRGPFTLGTIYPLVPGRTYLLCNSGGSAVGSDFLSADELSVVELPPHFSLSRLADMPLKEQLTTILTLRRAELDRTLGVLQHERALLDKALGKDEKYPGPGVGR